MKYKTMTVAELIAELSKYQSDTPVWAEWEGCLAHIGAENFILGKVGKENYDVEALVINVDEY